MNFGGRKLEPVGTKPDSILASANLKEIVNQQFVSHLQVQVSCLHPPCCSHYSISLVYVKFFFLFMTIRSGRVRSNC